jgi:hypothetical protein
MTIDLDELIAAIVRETLKELARLGIDIDRHALPETPIVIPENFIQLNSPEHRRVTTALTGSAERDQAHRATIDLAMYKTPVLTERHLRSIGEGISEIEIPAGTVITPGARELIKHRGLKVSGECFFH